MQTINAKTHATITAQIHASIIATMNLKINATTKECRCNRYATMNAKICKAKYASQHDCATAKVCKDMQQQRMQHSFSHEHPKGPSLRSEAHWPLAVALRLNLFRRFRFRLLRVRRFVYYFALHVHG